MLQAPKNMVQAEVLLKHLSEHRVKLGLGPTRKTAFTLGNPQLAYPTVHVAGTNGKGSTLALLDSLASQAGLKTGRTTSPHLVSPRERILLGGKPVSETEFCRALAGVTLAAGDNHPSYFELLTLAAFWFFRQQHVDLGLVEVGLGGRLDATRITEPVATIITPISMDHGTILGQTPAEIAKEKAAIARPGVPLILAPQPHQEAEQVIRQKAAETGSPVIPVTFEEAQDLLPGLPGLHQKVNGAVALTCYKVLEQMGFPACPHPQETLSKCHWPGRLQKLSIGDTGMPVWLDGAHNPAGCRALAEFMKSQPGPRMALFSALGDKNLQDMMAPFFGLVDRWVVCDLPDQPRRMTKEKMLSVIPNAIWAASPQAGWREINRLLGSSDSTVEQPTLWAFGSLYLVGALYQVLGVAPFPE